MRYLKHILLTLCLVLLASQARAFTFQETQSATSDAASSTFVFPAFNVATGSLVVGGVKWEGCGGCLITSVADTAGNTYALLTKKQNSGGSAIPVAQLFYALSAIANAANVITVTWDASTPTFFRGRITEITLTGGTTASFDVEANGEATTGTAPVTAAFSTANAAEYVFTLIGGFTSETWSSPLVGGNAATFRGASSAVDSTAFDYITSSAISSGTAGATMSVSNRWTIVTGAFKESSAPTLRNLSLMGEGN